MSRHGRFLLGVAALFLLAAVPARAQVLIERLITVNRNVADGGTLISAYTWSDANLASVTWTAVTLNFSSPFTSNPLQLGDLSAVLRFGTSTDFQGQIQGTVFTPGQLTSTTQTFTMADIFDGPWKTSDRWELRVTDNVAGGIARLNSWKIAVRGQADSTNALVLANGEKISTAADAETQTTVSSALSFGANTVDAEALAGKTLTFGGGLSGSGTLRATTEAGGKIVLSGDSADFAGTVRVAGLGTTEIADSRALGTGLLQQSNSQSTLRLAFTGTMTNRLSVYNVSFGTNGATLSGQVTVNNTDFDVASGDTNTVSGYVDGEGTVTKLGGGTLVLSGTTNSYTGITDVRNGTLRAVTVANSSNNSSIGAGTGLTIGSSNNAGTFVHTGADTTNSMNREVLVGSSGGTFSVEHSNSRVNLTGNVANQTTNAATLTKSGAGTLAFGSGANVTVSTIAVQEGTLLLGAANTIGNSTAINLAGGEFKAAGYEDTVGRLSVSADSIFDFGTAGGSATTFTFADFDTAGYGGAVLTINNAAVGSSFVFNYNYSGIEAFSGGANSFASKVQFGGAGQFGQISFGGGAGALGTTTLLVAIPDARVYTAAVVLLVLIGVTEYRRRRRLCRR